MIDYKIELLLNFLKIIPPLLSISFVSFFLTRLFKINNLIEKLLAIFILNCSQIIIVIEILSLFRKVTLLNLSIIHSVLLIICVILFIKRRMYTSQNHSNISIKRIFLNFYNNLEIPKIIKIVMIACLIIIIFTTFFIGMVVPPNNYDSMVYHLARAGFWNQNQTINHFYTTVEYQNESPPNAEIMLLWIMIFTNSGMIVFLVQWFSFIIILFALYKLLRLIGYNQTISFISVFIFSTFDIVILEANTTQNDLVAACFIILSFYFLLKILKSIEIKFIYFVLFGFSVGLAIGAKGYSYFFIPGFILFIIIYLLFFEKNKKLKYLKLIYILSFSILGVTLFSSYNLIQNFYSYGNIFTSPSSNFKLSVQNPTFKTLISNIFRQSAFFYQYNELDHGVISNIIKRIVIDVHTKLNMDISSPDTSPLGYFFYFPGLKINWDEGYFGLICFFFVLPSLFYTLILSLLTRIWKKSSEMILRFKLSLLTFLIPTIFFLLFCLIIRWQPYCGRMMIGLVLFLMILFSEFLDILKSMKFRLIFIIISVILIFGSIISSIKPLFNNDYIKLITPGAFSGAYEDRQADYTKKGKILADEILGKSSRLGLILKGGDWVYVLFGKNFERELEYIPFDVWNNNDLNSIFDDNSLDGILINTKEPSFEGNTLKSLAEKIKDKQILKLNLAEIKKYFRPVNGCEFIQGKNELIVKVLNDDPYFESIFPLDFTNNNSVILSFKIVSEEESSFKIYFGRKFKTYSEEDSKGFILKKGSNNIDILIDDVKSIVKFRIDPISIKKDVIIKEISFLDTKKFDYKISGEYLLIYR